MSRTMLEEWSSSQCFTTTRVQSCLLSHCSVNAFQSATTEQKKMYTLTHCCSLFRSSSGIKSKVSKHLSTRTHDGSCSNRLAQVLDFLLLRGEQTWTVLGGRDSRSRNENNLRRNRWNWNVAIVMCFKNLKAGLLIFGQHELQKEKKPREKTIPLIPGSHVICGVQGFYCVIGMHRMFKKTKDWSAFGQIVNSNSVEDHQDIQSISWETIQNSWLWR